jgi:hypothetical protein
MGNFPRNCQWMKLEIGNFEKIVFGNLWHLTESLKMFANGHLEQKCSFPNMGLSSLWVFGY